MPPNDLLSKSSALPVNGSEAIIAWSEDAILTKDLSGIITSWNPGAEKLFGYSAREAIGQPLLMLVPPERADEEPEILARIGRGEPVNHFDTVRIAKDGRRVDISVTISPLRDGAGTVIGASKIARDIGERLRSERALSHQASLLARSQQAARLGCIEVDFPAGYDQPWRRTWSDEVYRLMGIDPGMAPSQDAFMAAVHPDDRPLLEAVYAEMGSGRKPAGFRFRVPMADGGERILSCTAQQETDPLTGAMLRMFTTLQDITEYVRGETSLRHQAELLAMSQRVARLGSVECDCTVTPWRRTWSDEMFRLLRLDPRTVVPSREALLAVAHPDDRAGMVQRYSLLSAGDPVPESTFRVVDPDGTTRTLHVIVHCEHEAASGRLLRIFATYQDITDRVRADAAQVQAEARLRGQLGRLELLRHITHAIGQRHDLRSILQVVVANLEDHLPIDLVLCCRHDAVAGTLVVTNVGNRCAADAQALGLAPDTILPITTGGLARCRANELVFEPDLLLVPLPFPRLLAGAGFRSLVLVPLVVDGALTKLFIIAQRLPNAFSSPDCEFFKQLSEHVGLAVQQIRLQSNLQEAYDALRQSQQAMMQQERLRALGQMAGGVAHDINNAIGPAMIYTEWLLETATALTPPQRKQLTTIKRAIDDVAHTVVRLGEFYRRDDPQAVPVPMDVNEAMTQVIDHTRARWSDMPQQRGMVITLTTKLQPQLPAILGIANEVREALINLIFNAVDAMPEGGTLTLCTRRDGHRVVIEVTDTGIGMDQDTRERCLEPFFTTKGERGTGIGLAMVYGIAQRHGADITIASEPGKGTTMRLAFPEPPTLAVPPPTAVTMAPTRRLRILVIDDDPRLLQTLVDFLANEGHEVTKAEHGQAGVDSFRAGHAAGRAADMVITDLGMPHLDGRMVALHIKTMSPTTPIILLTGWGKRLIKTEVPDGVDRVLDKPPSLHALRRAIAELAPPATA